MASTIEEFRRLIYREVTLPSGKVVQIKRVQAWDFIGLGELPIPTGGGKETDAEATLQLTLEDTRRLKKYSDRALVQAVVSPRLTDAYDDGGEPLCGPAYLHVTELLESDYQALVNEIFEWGGLTKEADTAIQSFRSDALSETGEGVSGHVPCVAE
jgi:hypothetical protein